MQRPSVGRSILALALASIASSAMFGPPAFRTAMRPKPAAKPTRHPDAVKLDRARPNKGQRNARCLRP